MYTATFEYEKQDKGDSINIIINRLFMWLLTKATFTCIVEKIILFSLISPFIYALKKYIQLVWKM